MAAQFGTENVTTAPGETSLVHPVTDSLNRTLLKIAIQVQQSSEGWRLLQDSIAVIRPKQRMVGVFVYSPAACATR